MKVFTYPEKCLEDFGATAWEIEWWTLRPGAKGKPEIDWDRDIESNTLRFKTRESAIVKAKKILAAGGTFFGCVELQQQRVDWFVEEDRIAEWVDVGNAEEITAND